MSKGYANAAKLYLEMREADAAHEATCKRAYADGLAWGRAEPDRVSPPLSGEWGGESIPELSHAYGYDLSDSDVADSFEAGFYAGQNGGKQ